MDGDAKRSMEREAARQFKHHIEQAAEAAKRMGLGPSTGITQRLKEITLFVELDDRFKKESCHYVYPDGEECRHQKWWHGGVVGIHAYVA